jgi:aminopeptidase N
MNCRNGFCVCLWIFLLPCVFPQVAGARLPRAIWQGEFIDLAVELDPARGIMKGDAGIRLQSSGANPGDILLELNHELAVISVIDEAGRPLPFSRSGDGLTVISPKPPAAAGGRAVRVRYQGSFHERVPELDLRNAWIGVPVSHAFSSSRWYPQMPGPAHFCRGKIAYLVPADWAVASTGRLAASEALPGGKRYVFTVDTPAKLSFAAAAFAYDRRAVDGQEVGVFLLHGGPEKINFYLEHGAKVVRFLKDFYGFFPYEGFSLVELTADLLGHAGGGSYDGITFYPAEMLPENFFFSAVFAHEIGHCWWGGGNCVSAVEGPVINEGLAQVAMGLYIEHEFGERVFRRMLKDGNLELMLMHSARAYFQMLQSPKNESNPFMGLFMRGEDLALGIPLEAKRNTLHMLANSKGFFSYIMLRDLIGPDAFRQGLRGALACFAWKTMTLEDLRAQFEKASGRDLKWFFEQWFFRTGAPEFSLAFASEPRVGDWLVTGRVTQLREVYRVRAEIAFGAGSAREVRTVDCSGRETEFSFILPFNPQTVLFDPDYKILRWTEEFKK